MAPLPEGDPGPIASLALEPPYKLGERPAPASQEAYRQQIHELRHWGKGGLGDLIGALPGLEGHPDPRVIIDVARVKGPHDPKELQRLLRRNHWIHVVRCYRLGAYKHPELRGWTKTVVTVSRAGEIIKTRVLETELDEEAVAECMAEKLRAMKVSGQKSASQAWIDMKVGPGDEPLPPPEELIVAGDGTLAVPAMTAGVRSGLPAFEACYRSAFAYAPSLWGRILLRFHLTDRGKLDEVFEAGTQFPDPRVSQCIVRAARKLKFDKPEGGEIRFVAGLRLSSDRSRHELTPLPATDRPPQKNNGQE
jgi:hypothetical protein